MSTAKTKCKCKPKLSRATVALLRRVKAKILAEPRNFNMADFHNKCGTEHCIAGLASVLSDNPTGHGFELALSDGQRVRLLYVCCWPAAFQEPYLAAGGIYCLRGSRRKPVTCARIAAKRIDHFIATGGEE